MTASSPRLDTACPRLAQLVPAGDSIPGTASEAGAFQLDRRSFLKTAAAGLVISFTIGLNPRGARAAALQPNLGAYLQIAPDNTVTVYIGASEMGQGIMTGMAQLAAEELMLDWAQVKAVHAPAGSAYANSLFHIQATGGSTSMRAWYKAMRKAAAVAREMLLAAGASALGQAVEACATASGFVHVKADPAQKVPFSAIAAQAAQLTAPSPDSVSLVSTARLIGRNVQRTDIPAKVDGSAVFGIDVRVPGMLYAAVVHCPVTSGTVAAMPAKPSAAIALVNLGNAVGVVAADTWTAMKLANSLKISWTIPATAAAIDSGKILAAAKELLTSGTPNVMEPKGAAVPGDADAALATAATSIDVTYQLPFLAHACMEVLSCTASVTLSNGVPASCEIWAPTQGQSLVVWTAQALLKLPADKIVVNTTYLGGGLGRKFEQDFIAQSILIAKAVGKPVKLTWPRTQDFKNDKYRPCAAIRVRAGLSSSGALSSFIYRNVSPSITVQGGGKAADDSGAVSGALDLPYAISNRRIEYIANNAGVPLGYWRSVGESYNIFAVECAIDELALAGGRDPIAFRQFLLANKPGLQVLNAAVAMSAKVPLPANAARGVAFMEGFGSLIALIVEIALDSAGKIRVTRAFCALDCGVVVNPSIVEAQMQSGIAHGIAATLWGEVTFSAGTANVSNFNTYRMLLLSEMPAITVQTVMTGAIEVGGVGETGVPCVAPAIANAYAKLKGTRIRALPFYPGATMGGL